MSTRVASLASLVEVLVVFSAMLFASGVAVISSLGDESDDDFDMAVLVFGASVLDADSTAFTAIMFAFVLNTFSHHFFLWLRLPCPGPGIAE